MDSDDFDADICAIDPTANLQSLDKHSHYAGVNSEWWKALKPQCQVFGVGYPSRARRLYSQSWLEDIQQYTVVDNVLNSIKLNLRDHNLDHIKVFIMGGAVRDILYQCQASTKDFDIFFVGVKDIKELKLLMKLPLLDKYLPAQYSHTTAVYKYIPYAHRFGTGGQVTTKNNELNKENNSLFKKCTVRGEAREVDFDFVIGQNTIFQTMMLFDWYECMWSMAIEQSQNPDQQTLLFIRPKWDALCAHANIDNRYNNLRINLNIEGCHSYPEVLARGLYNAKRLRKPMTHKDFLSLSTLINLEISNGYSRTIRS